jgi:hypothetical protein
VPWQKRERIAGGVFIPDNMRVTWHRGVRQDSRLDAT